MLDDAELKRVLAIAAQGKHAARNRLALLLGHYQGHRVGRLSKQPKPIRCGGVPEQTRASAQKTNQSA